MSAQPVRRLRSSVPPRSTVAGPTEVRPLVGLPSLRSAVPGPAVLGPPSLGPAVRAALDALTQLAPVPAELTDGRVEAMLRAALAAHPVGAGVAAPAAVRTACAFLATAHLEDAYLALCTALDHLREPATEGPVTARVDGS